MPCNLIIVQYPYKVHISGAEDDVHDGTEGPSGSQHATVDAKKIGSESEASDLIVEVPDEVSSVATHPDDAETLEASESIQTAGSDSGSICSVDRDNRAGGQIGRVKSARSPTKSTGRLLGSEHAEEEPELVEPSEAAKARGPFQSTPSDTLPANHEDQAALMFQEEGATPETSAQGEGTAEGSGAAEGDGTAGAGGEEPAEGPGSQKYRHKVAGWMRGALFGMVEDDKDHPDVEEAARPEEIAKDMLPPAQTVAEDVAEDVLAADTKSEARDRIPGQDSLKQNLDEQVSELRTVKEGFLRASSGRARPETKPETKPSMSSMPSAGASSQRPSVGAAASAAEIESPAASPRSVGLGDADAAVHDDMLVLDVDKMIRKEVSLLRRDGYLAGNATYHPGSSGDLAMVVFPCDAMHATFVLTCFENIGIGLEFGNISVAPLHLARTAYRHAGMNNPEEIADKRVKRQAKRAAKKAAALLACQTEADAFGADFKQPDAEDDHDDHSDADSMSSMEQQRSTARRDRNMKLASRIRMEQILEEMRTRSQFDFDHLAYLLISCVIAGAGLAIDSVTTIVASMLVSPLMGPIMAMTFGANVRDWKLSWRGFVVTMASFGICIIVGIGVALVGLPFLEDEKSWPNTEIVSRGQWPILPPGAIIALVSGFGVALSTLDENASSLVGVAISAALLPPAVNIGLCWGYAAFGQLYHKDWNIESMKWFWRGSISLALVTMNVVLVMAGASLMFLAKEVAPHQKREAFWKVDIKSVRKLRSDMLAQRIKNGTASPSTSDDDLDSPAKGKGQGRGQGKGTEGSGGKGRSKASGGKGGRGKAGGRKSSAAKDTDRESAGWASIRKRMQEGGYKGN